MNPEEPPRGFFHIFLYEKPFSRQGEGFPGAWGAPIFRVGPGHGQPFERWGRVSEVSRLTVCQPGSMHIILICGCMAARIS